VFRGKVFPIKEPPSTAPGETGRRLEREMSSESAGCRKGESEYVSGGRCHRGKTRGRKKKRYSESASLPA